MIEILLLWLGSNKVADMAENKGHPGILWRVLFIASRFIGAIFSVVLAVVITSAGPRGGPNFCIGFFAYLLGGMIGIGAVTLAIAVWPEPPRERHYMDDYHEYQRTGRVRSYRDDDDRYDHRPRRRPRDEDDDRPRRRPRDDHDDRPRRDDRYRRDDDRPPRLRPDEDY